MTWASVADAPRGGVAPQTTRVANLAHMLTANARRLPHHPAIIWNDQTWSWAQLDQRVSALARGMREDYGVAKGDRILVQSRNSNQLLETMLAAFRLAAVWVPTNFRQTPSEVAWLATSSGAKLMIAGEEFAEHANACRDIHQHLTIGGSANEFEALIARHMGAEITNADVARDDPCWFFYTSGTTGRPKAGVLTHGQMAFVCLNHLNDLMPGTTYRDRSLCVAPLSHGAGVHALAQIAAGVPTILLPDGPFDAQIVWQLIEKHAVTNLFTVPTIVKILVEHPAVDRHDHSSLRYMIYAGAPMYRADQQRALAKLGPVIVQYFGLGEVTGNITVLPANEHDADDSRMRVGSCGYERTGMQVQIQDTDGNEVGAGETGEICVAGPAVFAGYYDNPEANAKAFHNGWFRTGDLGHRDAEGYVYITGRQSDMYISGGSNVYPREIEELLLQMDGVSEAAVLGVPDPKWGEVGLGVCVPEKGRELDPHALREALRGKLSSYKIPARIIVLSEMPKSGYGKITKKLIRQRLEESGLLDEGKVTS
jgi:fatty-acyl-CoA synthase